MPYEAKHFRSRDGLELYYRDYAGDPRRLPVLCLAGLTRNCMDFEWLAERIAPGRRVITPDQRGRGRSQYDPNWLNYHPGTYVEDMWTLLRELSVGRVIVIGTSLGGLMVMMMAAARPDAIAAVVLNDVGPEIDPVGARRIQGYVGRLPPVHTWDEAVEQVKMTFGMALPDYSRERWERFARVSFLEDDNGMPRSASDPRIGELLRAVPPGMTPGLWMAYSALRPIPTLAIRGELSDLLSSATFDRMQQHKPDLIRVTVPNRGHPPQLDEPEAIEAIESFLDKVGE
jgi:pimeloyl-ACP methyl ester carboxylesterase